MVLIRLLDSFEHTARGVEAYTEPSTIRCPVLTQVIKKVVQPAKVVNSSIKNHQAPARALLS
jgi:hypothetical protein